VESWKERTRTDNEGAFSHLFDPVRDAYAVQRLNFECPQNQEV
jgi:hypothetical protein